MFSFLLNPLFLLVLAAVLLFSGGALDLSSLIPAA